MKKVKIVSTLFGLMVVAQSALATNGFQSHCIGTIKCGTAGAGVASPTSAVDGLVNPSLVAKQSNHWIISTGVFHPVRTMDTSEAPMGNKVNKQTSKLENFPELSGGFLYNVDDNTTLAFSVAGSGGMATKYSYPRTMPQAQVLPPFDSRIMYRLIHTGWAVGHKFSDQLSLGVALKVGYSDIKTDSAKPVGQALVQTQGNNRRQNSFGTGIRFGGLWDINQSLTVGASYATPIWFKKFSKYNDIFLGPINTPMNLTLGLAWHLETDTDILFDVKRIFYKQVKTLGKTPVEGGFGWTDQTVFMLGITKRYEKLSISLGYNYAKSPIPKNRTFANALLPAVVEQHYTAGVGYKILENTDLLASSFYVPKKTQTDPGNGDMFSQFGKGTKVSMYQYGFQLGIKYNF